MMHSSQTIDLSILYHNLTINVDDKREKVVLIQTGALNPIHRGHISNLIRVKDILEKNNNFHVIGGYISPTHDQYVHAKLRQECIPGYHRIQMCSLAIKEAQQTHWMDVDQTECRMSQFVSASKIISSLRQFINMNIYMEKTIHVIYVVGLDHFNRCNGMKHLQMEPFDGVAVVYRSGEKDNYVYQQPSERKKVYYIQDEAVDNEGFHLSNISSTEIRALVTAGESPINLTYPSVLSYLKSINFVQSNE